MLDLKNKIQSTQDALNNGIKNVRNLNELEQVRVEFLGKKGLITQLMSGLKDLALDEKKEMGPLLYALKNFAEELINTKKAHIIEQNVRSENLKQVHFDVSAYLCSAVPGHLHPYSQCIEEIQDIFLSMGYEIVDTPELETEEYNFTGVNIPKDHPARDMHDTFWIDPAGILMRTHTSTAQIHSMKTKSLPLAVVCPGRTYRQEATDASHDFMFMQCEGCFVDKDVTLAHLFGTAQTFLKKLFNKKSLDIRIRPGFFPFVEPGLEIDMRCPFCKSGCSVCKKSTWLEVFPAGLIHPNVLKYCNIDPEVYSGFAFGFGLTRLVMLKYNIDDIRLLLNGKVKFLEQF